MPKYNFTNLVMPIELVTTENGIELIFSDAKATADFKSRLPGFDGKIVNSKIFIPNIFIHSLKNKNYIDELIAYYNKRGKDNAKKDVTLACITIALINLDLQQIINTHLTNIKERQEFLGLALDSTVAARFNLDTGLGTIIKKYNPTLEAYSQQKPDAKNVPKPQPIKLVDSTDLLKRIATSNAAYEQRFLTDSKHKLQADDQKEVKKQNLNLFGVTVTIETGNNKKDTTTLNQDAADAATFKLLPDSTPASLLTAMQAATQKTGDELLTYVNEGTTFTACALARFASGELVTTCAQLGDSGALLVEPKGKTTLLTDNQNMSNPCEIKRIIEEGYKNNILLHFDKNNIIKGRYLVDGCNFHLLDQLPKPLSSEYTNSYIFSSKNETLYYINSDNKAENIIITDVGKFRQTLTQIKNHKDTVWLELTGADWTLASNKQTATTMRLGHKQLNLLVQSVKNKQFDIDVRALGNSRFFGNGTFKNNGGSYQPECTQVLLTPGCKLVLFSDGVTDKLRLSQIAEFMGGSIRREAYLRGSTDDITTLIATELDQLPTGTVVLLIMADGHGTLGHKVSAEAIQKFIVNFGAQLSPVQQADAKHADQKFESTSTTANTASNATATAAAPAYRP